MKKIFLIMLAISLLMIAGCEGNKKNLYLPDAGNDKIYSSVGGKEETHQGEAYSLAVPSKNYRYEKDYDDGNLEEKWDYTKRDDVEIKVTTYENSDEATARSRFLRDNNDYIFEDLMGYPLCGSERNGDVLWFHLYETDGNVYIVSWEYPKNTDADLQEELSDIAETFQLAE